jgi:hypothetical protein
VNVTTVKAAHLTELREAVDQARAHAGLSAASWAESISSGVTLIKASHITELRARLAKARTALGLAAASYTDPSLTIGDPIKAAHVQELRAKTNETITAGGAGGIYVEWLVTDQLGTPRMIFDKSGSLANTKRHDYLPFGEEISVGRGGRTTAQGYVADTVRQKFTQSISSSVTLIRASHITELRARLAEARSALGLAAASYTDPNLTIGDPIKAAHVQEFRARTNEALTAGGTGGNDVQWLVADQLGTPRMIFDKTGITCKTPSATTICRSLKN